MTWTCLCSAIQDAYVAHGFGEKAYHNQTTLYPVGLILLIVAIAATLALPRKQALWPSLALASIVPNAQRLVVFGLDFSFARILVIVGILRIVMNAEHRHIRLTRLDRVVFAWVVLGMLVYTAGRGSVGALIYKLGMSIDTLGLYCLARVWIRGWKDIDRIGLFVTYLALFSGGLFLYEELTTRNLFSVVGGANEFTLIREGKLRCQGPFKHPILAGCFWAALLPWIVIRWWTSPQTRPLTTFGVAATLLIIVASASSTPLMGIAAILMAACLYPLRRRMRVIRWATVASLVALHLVMTKPVWHLITRINVISGSTGYHRYRLIDQAINRWREWFLLGTKSTAHWGYFLFDVTNQFIKEAVEGGIWTLGLFVWSIWLAFSYVGAMWPAQRKRRAGVIRAWGLGIALWCQCVMFIGVSVSWAQQNLLTWLLLLAACSSLWQQHLDRKRQSLRIPRVDET